MRSVVRIAVWTCAAALAFAAPAPGQSEPPTQPAQPPTGPVSNILSALTDMPPGWTRNMDGSYRQAEADVLCPKTFKEFAFRRFEAPGKDHPDVLGACTYTGDTGRIGTIRVRRYAADGGPLAANDKLLIAKGASAPPLLLHTGIDRRTGGGRATATVARNGLLVDCSVWQPEHSVPKSDFLLYCTTLTGS